MGARHADGSDAGTGAVPIRTLPGWSAKQFLLRGGAAEVVAILAGMACGLEGVLPGRWWYWASAFGSVVVACVALGLTWALRGYAKEKREVALGYATLWRTAVDDPALYFLSGDLSGVISAPHEPRPPTTRRKDMDAYLAARQTSLHSQS